MTIKKWFPFLVCKDGTKLSVQASSFHYCTPRSNSGPYTEVEMGFPSVAPTGVLLTRAEDPEHPCDTVYPYVPIAEIEQFIADHGGLDLGATLDTQLFH